MKDKIKAYLFKWHLRRTQKLCESFTWGNGCPCCSEEGCDHCYVNEWKNGATRYPYEYDELWRK